MKENDHVYILLPKAYQKDSKIPLREFRWVGTYILKSMLPNNHYVVRKFDTHKTQALHSLIMRPV